ncbi:MAG: hypothetical protein E7510_06720 [Ruminococcus sp.]|nr:hypothetical protein [Ruminococcus sp.]MBP1566593.1 hypothetical protein [Oscillospiraceae bacterium]
MVSKFSVPEIFRISMIELYKWIVNPRMITAVAMIIFVWNFAVDPLIDISHEMNSPLNFIEPFIAVFNSRTLCLVMPAMYIFLISDYPHLDRNSLFVLHRVRKTQWVWGQFFFFVISSFLFILLIFICTVLPNAVNSFVDNGWSLVVTRYGIYFPDKSQSFAATLITEKLHNQIAPYQAALFFFLLNWLYMILCGTVLLMFHVLNLRKIGVPVLISIVGIGSALGVFSSKGMWCFPMAHTMVSLHFTKYLRKPVMKIENSFLYFGVMIFVLLTVSLIGCKNTDFLSIDDNE